MEIKDWCMFFFFQKTKILESKISVFSIKSHEANQIDDEQLQILRGRVGDFLVASSPQWRDQGAILLWKRGVLKGLKSPACSHVVSGWLDATRKPEILSIVVSLVGLVDLLFVCHCSLTVLVCMRAHFVMVLMVKPLCLASPRRYWQHHWTWASPALSWQTSGISLFRAVSLEIDCSSCFLHFLLIKSSHIFILKEKRSFPKARLWHCTARSLNCSIFLFGLF